MQDWRTPQRKTDLFLFPRCLHIYSALILSAFDLVFLYLQYFFFFLVTEEKCGFFKSPSPVVLNFWLMGQILPMSYSLQGSPQIWKFGVKGVVAALFTTPPLPNFQTLGSPVSQITWPSMLDHTNVLLGWNAVSLCSWI